MTKAADITNAIWNAVCEVLPSIPWFLPFLGPLLAILSLLVFGPCLFNLLVIFVSSRLQQFHLQMMMIGISTYIPHEDET